MPIQLKLIGNLHRLDYLLLSQILGSFMLGSFWFSIVLMEPASDEDVAAAFSGGQPDALALVYQRFGALVYSIALRSLRARSDAEDVTQQVFVSAWQSRSSFNRGRGTLGGWLVTITRNKVTDALRERQRDSRVLLQVAGGAAVTAPETPPDHVVERIVLADEDRKSVV